MTDKLWQAGQIGKVHLHTVLPPVGLDLSDYELLDIYQLQHKFYQLYDSSIYNRSMQTISKMGSQRKDLRRHRLKIPICALYLFRSFLKVSSNLSVCGFFSAFASFLLIALFWVGAKFIL